MTSSRTLLFILMCFLCSTAAAQKVKAPKAYFIHEKGPYMNRVDVRKDTRGTENIIQIEALNVSGGSALISGPILPGAEITAVSATQGSYNMTREISKSGRGVTLQLLDVVFPFRMRATISEQILDVEIREPGFWKVAVGLTQ